MKYTLREARMLRDKTITEISEFLGVTRATYMKWENDSGLIRVSVAKKIADYLDMDIKNIFF